MSAGLLNLVFRSRYVRNAFTATDRGRESFRQSKCTISEASLCRGTAEFISSVLGQSVSSGHGSRRFSRSHHNDEVHIGNYRLIKTIGKGNFAKVKLATHVLTGVEVSLQFVLIVSSGFSWQPLLHTTF